MERDDSPRRLSAVDAARRVAQGLGLRCPGSYVLADGRSTLVHLLPEAVVAKVVTASGRSSARARAEPELSVGRHLAERRAPIARPTEHVAPGPHEHGAVVLTLWEFHPHEPGTGSSARVLGDALGELHRALDTYPGALPSFRTHLSAARRALKDPSATPRLGTKDRGFMMRAHDHLAAACAARPFSSQPLHGDPHTDGNVLTTRGGPLFVDFEAACIGPVEWDLSALPEEVARAYRPSPDAALLDLLRSMRSVCVAAWCSMQPERAAELERAARWHLETLRERVDV
jgi:Ser/Thr protein kinase RdoA (MazF antagonist)